MTILDYYNRWLVNKISVELNFSHDNSWQQLGFTTAAESYEQSDPLKYSITPPLKSIETNGSTYNKKAQLLWLPLTITHNRLRQKYVNR